MKNEELATYKTFVGIAQQSQGNIGQQFQNEQMFRPAVTLAASTSPSVSYNAAQTIGGISHQ